MTPRRFIAAPIGTVDGTISVPGDKSISHRAVMLGAVADGSSKISGFLRGEDCLATLRAFEALGVAVGHGSDGRLTIHGRGLEALRTPSGPLDLGNSGTAMRLLAGLLAGLPFEVELTGDDSLRSRPMQRIADPLAAMGARIATTAGRAPLIVGGGSKLRSIDYSLPIASAQVKSAILLAGLSASGTTIVRSPGPARDHTERMLAAMGVEIDASPAGDVVSLRGPATLCPIDVDVPGDFSSAAFFVVAGVLAADQGLSIRNVGVNPTRTGLLRMLTAMGAEIELRAERNVGAEPVADLFVRRSRLRGIDVPPEWVPLAIDEFPAFFVAAAGAEGRTSVRGADELRHKESDRLAVMARALRGLGIAVEELPDGLTVIGGRASGGTVDAAGDHRIAMACAVASVFADGPIEISNAAQIATSFPDFLAVARGAGLDLRSMPAERSG
jgi:3-phosphoshikimate 1-carboxyvinyltransferase